MKNLRLVNCIHTAEMLNYIFLVGTTLPAAKIELVLLGQEITSNLESVDLLGPFKNPRDLFLMFRSTYTGQIYAGMTMPHRQNL